MARISMKVRKAMSFPVIAAGTATTIHEAANRMRVHGVGALPVFSDRRPIGFVTDRDLVIRALATTGCSPQTPVTEIMSRGVLTCFEDQDVAEAAAIMGDNQIRRLLVIDRSGVPVGMLSLGDIAENVSEELAGQMLGEICEARAPLRFR